MHSAVLYFYRLAGEYKMCAANLNRGGMYCTVVAIERRVMKLKLSCSGSGWRKLLLREKPAGKKRDPGYLRTAMAACAQTEITCFSRFYIDPVQPGQGPPDTAAAGVPYQPTGFLQGERQRGHGYRPD